MFDPIDAFTRQFTPIDGGYLYYPSRRSGGKLVTDVEYEQLVVEWQRVSGHRGQWKIAGLVTGIILIWTIVSHSLTLPDWTEWVMTLACVLAISARFFWASSAPRRLVSGRPDITPPRSLPEAKREARALISWRFVIFALLFSGVTLIGTLSAPDQSRGRWAWLIGSGTLFTAYIWVAYRKVMDQRS